EAGVQNKEIIAKKHICILESYFRTNKVPVIQDMLNSTSYEKDVEQEKSKSTDEENIEKDDVITFKFTDETIDVELKKTLRIIRQIRFMNEQKLDDWLDDFEEISKHKNWNIKQQYSALRLLIKDPMLEGIFSLENFDLIKEEIRGNVLRKMDSSIIQYKLGKLRQTQYKYVREYLSDIKRLIDKYAKVENISKNEYNRKLKESFFQGLGFATKMKVFELGKKKLEDTIEFLEQVEENLITEMDRMKFQKTHQNVKESISNFINNKWCAHCKTNSHTTKTCYKLNRDDGPRRQEITKSRKEEKSCVMKERRLKTLELEILGNIGGQKIQVMVDTGASRNYINANLIKELNLEMVEEEPLEVMTANGAKVRLNDVVNCKLILDGIKKVYNCTFYVLQECASDVILGNEFIFNNSVILDFKRNIIRIEEEELKILKENEEDVEELDKIFYEKLGLIKNNQKSNIKELIEQYRRKNSEFKEMKITPVQLKRIETKIELGKRKAYMVPCKYVERAKDEINRLMDEGIIVESEVKYVSPAFFIEKRNSDLRLVIDYRGINNYIIDECYDIPKIYENLMYMGENEYFSTIDLKNGFNQIPLEKESQEVTGFMLMNKTYKYLRVPFGIRSGPKLFQKTISKILEGIENCFIYIDDIIIYSKGLEEHDRILEKVLKRLQEYEIRINFEKSSFYNKEIKLLGYFVSKEGLTVDTKYLQNKIFEQLPRTKKQLQKIIGVFNWYRRFISNLSDKLKDITDMLSQERFIWNEEHTKMVKKIKEEIECKVTLKFPDFTKKFILEVDASNEGIGAVLYQEKGVIGYFSKKLNKTEQNYSIVEKELLGMVKGLFFFKDIIQGYYTEVFTDNKNCVIENKKFTSRMERWKVLLNDFNLKVISIEGKNNNVADCLSRGCLLQEIKSTQKEKYLKMVEECRSNDEKDNTKKKITIKPERETKFLKFIHKISGHAGVIVNFHNLKRYFNIKYLVKKLQRIIKKCSKCKRIKNSRMVIQGNVPLDSKEPFEKISSDIYGPFRLEDYLHKGLGENGYFITITDIYTRISHIEFVTTIGTKEVINVCKKWVSKYKKPKVVIMDNGVQYTSNEFKEFLYKLEIKPRYIPKFTPSSNGISERINVVISEMLRLHRGRSIRYIVKKIHHRLNENHNTTIQCSPKSLISGVCFYNPFNNKEEFQKPKNKNNESSLISTIKIGDKVYLKNFTQNKLEDRYIGPFEVINKGAKGKWIKLGNNEWVHIKNLKF
ncbi:Retrovirus-related Pol polyprotein from transposon, partial [Nosema granulosis]